MINKRAKFRNGGCWKVIIELSGIGRGRNMEVYGFFLGIVHMS